MALVDSDLRFVDVNAAGARLWEVRREDVIGRPAGTEFIGGRSSVASWEWQKLLRDKELYGEQLMPHPSGRSIRVSYAAHATTLNGEWLVLFVMLSATLEPHGAELIRTTAPTASAAAAETESAFRSLGKSLTPREREVVRRVALGRSTPQIAGDLSLSPATVRSHVRNAMVKVGAHTRAQLVALVLGEGLAGD